MRIGSEQQKRLEFLNETLEGLQRSVGRDNRDDFDAMQERLENWAARIAVIGQVKAGKSTFLNAFLQRHDFLPNDVNPWTSVVTNMRVNDRRRPAGGARFDFFSAEDWDEIIDGSSKTRKLAEQLLPGFDGELLRQQGLEMQEWARKNLGQHYEKLLGTNHEYEFVTPDLLKRYVCAGSEKARAENGALESTGRYAALTRQANVWLQLPEFQVPAVISDTPGVNDPFLVRDEVTCRALDKSDIFVVVLSAHQALTDVDIGLIRILVQQDSKEVLIFVNRLDELDDYHRRYDTVLNDVARRLQEAIPGIEFDITCGSAFMADAVFRSDAEAEALRAELDNETLTRFLERAYGYVPESREDRLLLGSGMDVIKQTLARIIDNGEGSRQLTHLQEDMRTKVMAVQFAVRREHASVRDVLERLTRENPAQLARDMQDELDQIGALNRSVEARIVEARDKIEGSLDSAWSLLEHKLNSLVERFVDGEQAALEQHILSAQVRGRADKGHVVDITPLHQDLEELVRETYDRTRSGLDRVLDQAMAECSAEVADTLSEDFSKLSLEALPYDSFTSTLAMSRKSIKIDLISERSWTFWKRGNFDIKKSTEAVKAVALAEMRPALEKLVGAFNEAQSERASAGMERLGFLQKMIEYSFEQRAKRVKNDRAVVLEMATNDVMRSQVTGRLQSQIEILERRLQVLSVTESALNTATVPEAA